MRKRIRYRKEDGSIGHLTELNFADLPPTLDEDNNEIPIEETLADSDNFFNVYQKPDKGGDLDFYKPLDGIEGVILFCIARGMSQEKVADYFSVSIGLINKIKKRAFEKIKQERVDLRHP